MTIEIEIRKASKWVVRREKTRRASGHSYDSVLCREYDPSTRQYTGGEEWDDVTEVGSRIEYKTYEEAEAKVRELRASTERVTENWTTQFYTRGIE